MSNEEIRALMHNYSRMHQPGHYSDTEFDCLQDVIAFVRECIKQDRATASGAVALSTVDAATPDSRVQAVFRDAGRYAYVRETTTAIRDPESGERAECTPEQFDAAIDAGMQRRAANGAATRKGGV